MVWEVDGRTLTGRHEEGVEHAHSLRKHGDLQALLFLEVTHELVQGHLLVPVVGQHEPVPEGPLVAVVRLGRSLDGLGEIDEGQGQVGESVLVLLQLLVALDKLVELEADEAADERSGGGDGRNDSSGDQLGLVTISLMSNIVFLVTARAVE